MSDAELKQVTDRILDMIGGLGGWAPGASRLDSVQPLVGGTIQAATLPMPIKPVNRFARLEVR